MLFKSLGEEWFSKYVKEYFTNLIKIRKVQILKQLMELREKFSKLILITAYFIEYSELETFYPKYGHSVVANKDFIFITGGEYNDADNSFEILVLKDGERKKQRKEDRKILIEAERKRRWNREEEKEEEIKLMQIEIDYKENEDTNINDTLEENDIFICRGPNLKKKRSRHASVIIKNYLYVIFGFVKNKNKPCMSFERIEIPPPNMTRINIDEFYKSKEWEYYEIDYNFGKNVYFSCSNCIKTFDNNLVFYGTKRKLASSNHNLFRSTRQRF